MDWVENMKKIETERLILRNFEESDYEDLFEFLAQRKEDDFEAYPDITYENGREHLAYAGCIVSAYCVHNACGII